MTDLLLYGWVSFYEENEMIHKKIIELQELQQIIAKMMERKVETGYPLQFISAENPI